MVISKAAVINIILFIFFEYITAYIELQTRVSGVYNVCMRKVFASLLVFVFAILFVSASSVSAKIISNENGVATVSKTEVINDDLFIGAKSVQLDGVVNGDVFIGAETVKVSGIINGNLHVGTSLFDLTGVVKGNVYVGAQSVTVTSANIGGSIIVGGATVNVDKDSVIGGSVITGAGSLNINSQVKRSVYAGVGTFILGEAAKVGKDLYYMSDSPANISNGAKVTGATYKSETNSKKDAEEFKKNLPGFMRGFNLAGTMVSILGALIVGLIYIKFFGRDAEETSELLSNSFWKSLGIGFVISIVFIPAVIILLITVIGIPLAGISVLVFLLYSALSKVIVGLTFGNWAKDMLKRKMSVYMTFALGLLLIYLLKMVPMVGLITGLVVFWSGLGALSIKSFGK